MELSEGSFAAVRQFLQEEFVPHDQRSREQHHVDRDARTKAGTMGLLLTDVSEEWAEAAPPRRPRT